MSQPIPSPRSHRGKSVSFSYLTGMRYPGLLGTLLAALSAASLCGLLFGVADAVVADFRVETSPGSLGRLGCYAAAVMSYALLAAVLLVPAALVLHRRLRSRGSLARLRPLLTLGLFVGIFAELYWWTRPFVFYGHSSVSPERLGAAVVQGALGLALAVLVGRGVAGAPERVHRGARALVLGCVVAGLLFVHGESARVERRGVITERNRELPNVLLVVVDALRADHLGCYGNEELKTPNIDALAERGVVLDDYYAQAPYTLTSFGSILTGKYPRRHGLVAQRPGVRMKPNLTLPLHLKSARLARGGGSLSDDDYATATFMTGALSHGSGLARGFDVYSEAMLGHDPVEVDSRWSLFRSELLPWLFQNKLKQRVDSSLVVHTAREWLEEHRGRRWMAMVHLFSTHTPYDPPESFREPYLDPGYDGPFDAFYAEHRYAIEAGDYSPSEADLARIRGLYAAGAAQADAMIGELLAELEASGDLASTIVIVTADHGEDLGELRHVRTASKDGEMRYWEHNHMWQTNLRIPLVIAAPGRLPSGVRAPRIVETIDLLPTPCDLIGIEPPAVGGPDEIDGRSFLPLVRAAAAGEGSDEAEERYTFAENNLFVSVQDRRYKLVVPRPILAVADPGALLSTDGWVRFFDLEEDPDEGRDLYAEASPEMLRLWAVLRRWDASMPRPEYTKTDRDEEQLRWLAALGYAGGIDPGE